MAALVIDSQQADDPRDVIHRAVQAIAEGKVVVFPTETVYVAAASALNDTAVARLSQLCRGNTAEPVTLAVKSLDEALDYVPSIPPVGLRLARRCWPGPVTLQLQDSQPGSLRQRLPTGVQQIVAPADALRFRVPAHELIFGALRLLAAPVAMATAKRPGDPDPVTAEEAIARIGQDVDLVLDAGRCRYALPSSIVQFQGNRLQVTRQGAVSEANLKRLASWMAILVCTGNTCRSPMAESLLRKRISERLGCRMDELEDRGIIVTSAGVSATPGCRPSHEAVVVLRDHGLDLSPHESQPLTDRLVQYADLILTMTRGHREAILAHFPEAATRTHLISRQGGDVADPIGGPTELYRRCAEQIDQCLSDWVDELNFDEISGT